MAGAVTRIFLFFILGSFLATGASADDGFKLKGLSETEEHTLHVLEQYNKKAADRLRKDFKKNPTQGGRLRALKRAYDKLQSDYDLLEGLEKKGVAGPAAKVRLRSLSAALRLIELYFRYHVKYYKKKEYPGPFGDGYAEILQAFDKKSEEWSKKRAKLFGKKTKKASKPKPKTEDDIDPNLESSNEFGTPNGDQLTSLELPAGLNAGAPAVSQPRQVTVANVESGGTRGVDGLPNPFSQVFPGGLKLSLDLATSSTEPNFNLDTNFGNFGGGGEDTLTSIGVDARGTFGRLPNLPVSFFAGAWGRINLGGEEQNRLSLDLHPTVGLDTFAYLVTNGFAMPYFGVSTGFLNFANTDTDVDLSLYTGLRVESRTLTLHTDESGGGGTPNKFRKTKTQANVTIGGDVDIKPGNLPVFFRFGAAVDFNSSMKVTGRSAVNGNTYELETGGQPVYRMIFGVGLPL